jgi:hypothetical protein
MSEPELREFAKGFVSAYTEYSVAELEEKKRDGERFDPPYLTQEEYQEMAVREKWPRIGARPDDVSPLQLCREIARAAMLFRPYMLSDTGFNEGVLEFSLYLDLLERLRAVPGERLRDAARVLAQRIGEAVAASSTEEAETLLREVRTIAGAVAGLPADPEELLGPPMEKHPREVPPEYRMRALRNTLATMTLKDLRLTALVHLDLLTAEETRRIVGPFFTKYPSFYEMPSKGLRELVLAVADGMGDRAITWFIERYGTGRMAMTRPVEYLVWKLMPEEERVGLLRLDNGEMDAAMMARHFARFLRAESEQALSDAGRQIALLTDASFVSDHGEILSRLGGEGGGERIKKLYDLVTLSCARMAGQRGEERAAAYRTIRGRIAATAGVPEKNPDMNPEKSPGAGQEGG